jgi:hypothetical protein
VGKMTTPLTDTFFGGLLPGASNIGKARPSDITLLRRWIPGRSGYWCWYLLWILWCVDAQHQSLDCRVGLALIDMAESAIKSLQATRLTRGAPLSRFMSFGPGA